jgi:DnaJ-class molecular chaperone
MIHVIKLIFITYYYFFIIGYNITALTIFNMPTKYRRCSTCSGTGHELEIGEETCPSCVGTGRDKNSDLWAEPCGNCKGSGRVTYSRRSTKPCRGCNGTGTIQY